MILNRLQWKLGKRHPYLFGFQPHTGTTDAIATLLNKITERGPQNTCYVVFLDLEKAFELANADAILYELAGRQVSGRMMAWIEDFLTNKTARVKLQNVYSDYKPMENGTPQGSVLSPALFNILMEALLRIPLPTDTFLLSYADDLAPVSTETEAEDDIQQALNTLATTAVELGLKFSTTKTKAMALSIPDPAAPLKLLETDVDWVSSYRYLGITLDKGLTLKEHTDIIQHRMRQQLNIMRAMTSRAAGATSTVLRKYYITRVRSIVDYSACALMICEPILLHKLNVMQNIALRHILGAPGWTKIETMLEETDLLPIPQRIEQMGIGLALKTLTSHDRTPIKEPLEAATRQETLTNNKNLMEQLAQALRKYAMDKNPITEDVPRTEEQPPWIEPPGQYYVVLPEKGKKATDQKALKAQTMERITEINKDKDVIFYTDGSVDHDTEKAGAGIVAILPRAAPPDEVIETAIRVADRASTPQTELTAITAALAHVEEMEAKKIAIHTDSLTSIQSLQTLQPTDNKELITAAQQRLQRISEQGGMITIHWVPSHIGIPANEQADQVAAAATALTTITVRPPHSKSPLKKDYEKSISSSQTQRITALRPGSRSITWRRTAAGDRPFRMPRSIGRKREVAIYRLRLGYRCRTQIKGPVEVECTHCDQNTSHPLVHYVLECPLSQLGYDGATDMEDISSDLRAAQLIKTACLRPTDLADHVGLRPPPR